jgi:hypothetical protein
MFNPAFIFVFEENELEHPEMLIKNFLDLMAIVSVSIIACGFYGIIISLQIPAFIHYICSLIWSTLTPGKEWLEIVFILSSLGSSLSILIFLNALMQIVDGRIKKMRESLQQREKEIAELEAIIEEQEQQKQEQQEQEQQEQQK